MMSDLKEIKLLLFIIISELAFVIGGIGCIIL